MRTAELSIGAVLLALVGCTQTNKEHCGNREGDKTCEEQGGGAMPFCSSCESANNGCVATLEDQGAACHADTGAETTGGSATMTTSATATMSATSNDTTASTTESTTASTTMTTTEDTTSTTMGETTLTTSATEGSSGDESSSSTTSTGNTTGEVPTCPNEMVDDGEQCDGADLAGETCDSQGFAGGVLACTDQCQLDLTGCEAFPACGDNNIDRGEQCDGAMLSVPNCDALNPGLYGGGDLTCEDNCSFNTDDCCVAGGQGCNQATNCCNGNCAGLLCL